MCMTVCVYAENSRRLSDAAVWVLKMPYVRQCWLAWRAYRQSKQQSDKWRKKEGKRRKNRNIVRFTKETYWMYNALPDNTDISPNIHVYIQTNTIECSRAAFILWMRKHNPYDYIDAAQLYRYLYTASNALVFVARLPFLLFVGKETQEAEPQQYPRRKKRTDGRTTNKKKHTESDVCV